MVLHSLKCTSLKQGWNETLGCNWNGRTPLTLWTIVVLHQNSTIHLKVLVGLVALSKLPIRRSNIIKLHHFTITSSDLKWQGLSYQIRPSNPILSPNTWHRFPASVWRPFDAHLSNITSTGNIVQQNQQPIRVPFHLKLDTATFVAWDTAIHDWDDPCSVYGNFGEHFHGQVEVFLWRVAPMVEIRWVVIRGAEICCGHFDWACVGNAPLGLVHTHDLKTCTTSEPIVE